MSLIGDDAIGTSPEDVAMNAYADGDDRALNVVYDALAPRLFGFFLRRARSREVAEDLLQRTFLQIHRHRANFLRGAAVAPWAPKHPVVDVRSDLRCLARRHVARAHAAVDRMDARGALREFAQANAVYASLYDSAGLGGGA